MYQIYWIIIFGCTPVDFIRRIMFILSWTTCDFDLWPLTSRIQVEVLWPDSASVPSLVTQVLLATCTLIYYRNGTDRLYPRLSTISTIPTSQLTSWNLEFRQNISTEISENRLISFCVILLKNKQTNKRRWTHNLMGRENYPRLYPGHSARKRWRGHCRRRTDCRRRLELPWWKGCVRIVQSRTGPLRAEVRLHHRLCMLQRRKRERERDAQIVKISFCQCAIPQHCDLLSYPDAHAKIHRKRPKVLRWWTNTTTDRSTRD